MSFIRNSGATPEISQAGSKAVPQRVKGPARNHEVSPALQGLQINARFADNALETSLRPRTPAETVMQR